MIESTIPQEIIKLGLPDISEVIVIGGAAMELNGLRVADDIDMVVSLKNWRYLRDSRGWMIKRKFSGRLYLADKSGRFDVWRWWFNPQSHSRTKLSELYGRSTKHPAGFYIPTIDWQIEFKRQLGRPKDLADIELLQGRLR
jgi:hypothetical protein